MNTVREGLKIKLCYAGIIALFFIWFGATCVISEGAERGILTFWQSVGAFFAVAMVLLGAAWLLYLSISKGNAIRAQLRGAGYFQMLEKAILAIKEGDVVHLCYLNKVQLDHRRDNAISWQRLHEGRINQKSGQYWSYNAFKTHLRRVLPENLESIAFGDKKEIKISELLK